MSDALASRVATTMAGPRIHATAIVEDGVTIGNRTAVWDNAHLRSPSVIGHDCIIGEKTYIAYGVQVGNYVKINAGVYICTGIAIEDRVMISAGVIFTNDRNPRAFRDGQQGLAPSEPDESTLQTRVETGVTIGAGAIIGPGLTLGAFSMIGMGSVVTHNVAPHALVMGNPGRVRGYIGVCGQRRDFAAEQLPATGSCGTCRRRYNATNAGGQDEIRIVFNRLFDDQAN